MNTIILIFILMKIFLFYFFIAELQDTVKMPISTCLFFSFDLVIDNNNKASE